MVRALRVRRNAKRGAAFGVLFTAAIFLFFVVLPPEGPARSPVFYAALAFVLAMATTGLATLVLVARRALKLSREL